MYIYKLYKPFCIVYCLYHPPVHMYLTDLFPPTLHVSVVVWTVVCLQSREVLTLPILSTALLLLVPVCEYIELTIYTD